MSTRHRGCWVTLRYKNRSVGIDCMDGIARIVRFKVPASTRNWKPQPAGFYTCGATDLADFYKLVGVANY